MPGDVRQTVRREFDRLLMDEERDRDARIDDACKRDARIGELLKKRTLTMTNAYAQALSDHRAPDRDAIRAATLGESISSSSRRNLSVCAHTPLVSISSVTPFSAASAPQRAAMSRT